MVTNHALAALPLAFAWHFSPVPGCVPCWNNPDPLSWLPSVMLNLCCPSELSGNHWLSLDLLCLPGLGTMGFHPALCLAGMEWTFFIAAHMALCSGSVAKNSANNTQCSDYCWTLVPHRGFLSFPLCPTETRLGADKTLDNSPELAEGAFCTIRYFAQQCKMR